MEFHAFLSYAQVDDDYSNGAITQLRNLIEKEGRRVTGKKEFAVFRDKLHISPGDDFEVTIAEALEKSFILLPIITPTYFESGACLDELEMFVQKENNFGRQDLVIPIYFVEANDMARTDYAMNIRPDNVKRAAGIFKQRQYVDLRQFNRSGFFGKDGSLNENALDILEKIGIAIRTAYRTYRAQDELHKSSTSFISTSPFKPAEPPIIGDTLFKERLSHFRAEKEHLADKFGDYLIARLEHFCRDTEQRQKNKVILFIDSGTTLFHFFKKIGDYAKNIKQQSSINSWINNLVIVTNNIEGAQSLIREGKIANEKTADVAVQCVILPGVLSSVYSATVGISKDNPFYDVLHASNTPNVIKAIFEGATSNKPQELYREGFPVKIISLISGNWVRVRQTTPRIAIPLVRETTQYDIKQALVDSSDEIYLVTPLGKIFADHQKSEVANVLRQYINKSHPGHPPYNEIEHSSELSKIRLVTTYRSSSTSILANLSDLLARDDFLDAQMISQANFYEKLPPFRISGFRFVPNLMFEFNHSNKGINAQIELEFPHKESRNKEFLGMFNIELES